MSVAQACKKPVKAAAFLCCLLFYLAMVYAVLDLYCSLQLPAGYYVKQLMNCLRDGGERSSVMRLFEITHSTLAEKPQR